MTFPKDAFIWIDQICINQSNLEEKTFQVSMMANIYLRSSSVRVWLGQISLLEQNVVKCIQDINIAKSALDAITPSLKENEKDELEGFPIMLRLLTVAFLFLPTRVCDWVGLLILLSRSWFQRVWVVQEFVLPQNIEIFVGTTSIPLAEFFSAAEVIRSICQMMMFDHVVELLLPLKSITDLERIRKRYLSGFQMDPRHWINICRGRHATDERDLVFAGASMIGEQPQMHELKRLELPQEHQHIDETHELGRLLVTSAINASNPRRQNMSFTQLEVSYNDPVNRVYSHFTERLMRSSLGMDVLSFAGVGSGLSSWVVDLREKMTGDRLTEIDNSFTSPYVDLPPLLTIQRDTDVEVLCVQGSLFTEVTYVSPTIVELCASSESELSLFYKSILGFVSCSSGKYRLTKEPLVLALARTFAVGNTTNLADAELVDGMLNLFCMINYAVKDRWTSPKIRECRDGKSTFSGPENLLGIGSSFTPDLLYHTIKSTIKDQLEYDPSVVLEQIQDKEPELRSHDTIPLFYNRFRKTFQDKRIFLGEKEVIGAGPLHTAQGDTVAFIAGAHVPFILSKSQPVVGEDGDRKSEMETYEEGESHYEDESCTEAESWKLVGETYVHGTMHGEIDVEALRSLDVVLQTIRII